MNSIKFVLINLFFMVSFLALAQEKFGGATLYTVRDAMAKDPKGTMKRVADLGYKYIEAVDYKKGKFYGMTPEEFKKEVSDLGMIPLSVHMGGVTLENADQLIADAKKVGFKYFVAPVPPMGLFSYDPATQSLSMSDDVEYLVSILDEIGGKCKEAGLEFLYHNHNFEFLENANGVVPMDYMLENLDSENVNFQLDLYWVTKAEADPIAYFEKYPGRFKVWHVKDMDDQGRFAPVGSGSIDFGIILDKKDLSGMEYYIVEQDRTFDGMKPFEALELSRKGLTKFGFN